jgi:hypothetical protein
MEKKKISPRVEDQTRDYLSKHFSTINAGAEYVLDGFPMLYNRALHEIKGRFTEEELSFLVEAFKDTKLGAQLAGQQLRVYCDDAMTFRKLDEKWHLERDGLLQKIREMPSFQTACLEIWARTYWFRKWNKGEKAMREYVAALL